MVWGLELLILVGVWVGWWFGFGLEPLVLVESELDTP